MAINIIITDAGRAEIINAENTGTAPVEIAEIGFGLGQYLATADRTALQTEIKRLTTFSGAVVSDDVIHVTCRDETSDEYDVYEIGLFTDSGTLFAVYSQIGTPIIQKGAQSIALLAADITLQSLDAGSITFGNVDFVNPPASETVAGIIRKATDPEAENGDDVIAAVTPDQLHAVIQMINNEFGIGAVKSIADANTVLTSGFYSMPAFLGATNSPLAGESGALLVIRGGADTNYVTQIWSHSNDTDNQSTFIRHKKGAGPWSPWVELLHSGNVASNSDALMGSDIAKWMTPALVHLAFKQFGYGVSAVPLQTSTDFNTLITSGYYVVTDGVNSPPGTSPSTFAVCVIPSIASGRVEQIAMRTSPTGPTNQIFYRCSGTGAVNWSNWVGFHHTGNGATNEETKTGTIADKWVSPSGVHATLNQYGVGAGVPSLSAQNMNSDRPTGFYYMVSPTNGPGGNGWLLHEKLSTTYATQTFTTVTGEKYFRSNNNGTWTAWNALKGSNLKTIWTGSSTIVDMDSVVGGHPGSGDYLIDINGTIAHFHIRVGLNCSTAWSASGISGSGSSAFISSSSLSHDSSGIVSASTFRYNVQAASVSVISLNILGIYKIV